uniref:Nucleolar protein 9 n=1 Tax=Amblyomma maculatum TaxID=34609 RepID=G3MQR9_AMBMU
MKPMKRNMHRSRNVSGGKMISLRRNGSSDDAGLSEKVSRGDFGHSRDCNWHLSNSNNQQFSQLHQVDKDTKSYFVMVCERFHEDFEDEEDKALFLENVADQTCGKELQLSCDDSTSHCMQMLLLHTRSLNVLTRFMSTFLEHVDLMCTHHIAAYVMQTLLEASLRYLQSPSLYTSEQERIDAEPSRSNQKHMCGSYSAKEKLVDRKRNSATHPDALSRDEDFQMQGQTGCHDNVVSWVLAVGRFCLENIEKFAHSGVPTHVLRSVVQVLGGCYVERHLSRPQTFKKKQKTEGQKEPPEVVNVPDGFDELFRAYVNAVKTFDLLDIMSNSVTSLLLQALIMVLQLKDPKMLSSLVKHIAKAVFAQSRDERGLPPAFLDPSASFTVEEILKRCSPKSFTKLWDNHLSDILLKMSLHPVSTFCAQRVIEHATSPEQFQEMYEKLEPGFNELLDHGQVSMLVCIAAACKTHSMNQARFVTALMRTLHCAEPEERHVFLTPLILYMKRYEEYDQTHQGTAVVYQGSMLLQHLFTFGKTQKVAQSLLNMNTETLKAIACCPCGSHVLDAFVQSDQVKKANKEQLIRILKGLYGTLAMDKYGSCFVMNLWDVASMAQKVDIAEELSDKESALATSVHGRLVSKKVALHHFIHRRNDWAELQKNKKKTSLLFQDIIKEK